ncbi:hypothetical protein CNR22_16155 [Sphingobacteriaceae bacterium]|nr:hypothetical protein CNR22_16155 [Sphingobacteriaceae bacterium]
MNYFCVLIFITCILTSSAQTESSLLIGATTEKKTYSANFTAIKNLLETYNAAILENPTYVGSEWAPKVLNEYTIPDYLLKQEISAYRSKFQIKPNLMYIFKMDSCWVAQMAYHLYDGTEFKGLLCVYNFGVTKIQSDFKLVPYAQLQKFKQGKTKTISYYSHENSVLSASNIDSLENYNNFLSRVLKTPVISFKCYNYLNFAELNICNGLIAGNFSHAISENAYTDIYNSIIHTTSFESLFHESTHLYNHQLNPVMHPCIDEGLACYFGSCQKKPYTFHLAVLQNYLQLHPEINLNNTLYYHKDFISQESSFETDMGSLLAAMAFGRWGYAGILKLTSINSGNEEFYAGITNLFNVKREDLNVFLRDELKKYTNGSNKSD